MGKAQDQSLNPNNKTSTKARIGSRNAGPSATTLCRAYELAKKIDPSLEFKMTFSEWRTIFMRNYDKNRRKRKQDVKHGRR